MKNTGDREHGIQTVSIATVATADALERLASAVRTGTAHELDAGERAECMAAIARALEALAGRSAS